MNSISHRHWFSVSVVILLFVCSLNSCRQSPKILPLITNTKPIVLIINSDQSVDKYATIQREFESELNLKTFQIDLAEEAWNDSLLQEQLSSVHPHLVYAIGSKAYIQASRFFEEVPVIFSSLINWRRFDITSNTYGISLELPIEMQLLMYSYLFPEIRTLGVLYSERHNRQWFDLAMSQVEEVGLSLHGQLVDNSDDIISASQTLLPKVDAIWLISDPVVLYEANQVRQIFAEAAFQKKPIFAYDTLFSQYGALLTIAADIPTMGRQAAGLAQDILKQQTVEEKVQFPAGSHVTLNLKKVHEYGITINHAALSSVEKIIE